MLYKNVNIKEVNPVVYLGEKTTGDWKLNEKYIIKKVGNIFKDFSFSYECPIDDLVFLYFYDYEFKTTTEIADLKLIYTNLEVLFSNVKINLLLDEYIEGEGNSIDLNLKEFIQMF